MGPRTFWSIVLVLGFGVGTIGMLTAIKNDAGDPLVCMNCYIGGHHHHASESIRPNLMLKTIVNAQADFRANDRDGDGVPQFWRADIAGLYALAPGGGPAIRLIEQSVALADARRASDYAGLGPKTPQRGYLYRAIRHTDEPKPDAETRFAAVAFPANYPKPFRWTFIVDERNAIYRADLGHGQGVGVFPTDEELKAKWAKVD
jgi:hypothetical protein